MGVKDWRIVRSISFSPELAALCDALKGGENERSAWLVETLETVIEGRGESFRPKPENAVVMREGGKKLRRKLGMRGPDGRETWSRPNSISFPPAVFEAIEAHRARLGMGRSRYVTACVEHVCGVRPHPELYEPSMRA